MTTERLPQPDYYHQTHLIQTLRKPYSPPTSRLGFNPFTFGSGHSGLSKEGLSEIGRIWDFAYMGAAEYEFGIVGEALRWLVWYRQQNLLVAHSITVQGDLAVNKNGYWGRPSPRSPGRTETTIYLIACCSHAPDAATFLNARVAEIPYKDREGRECRPYVKNGAPLWDLLFNPEVYWDDRREIGGLECDNGWLYFHKPEPFLEACKLFDIVPSGMPGKPAHVPPKVLLRDQTVEDKIIAALRDHGPKDEPSLIAAVYGIDTQVIPDDQVRMATQVGKRLKSLVAKRQISRDKGTKCYAIVVKETGLVITGTKA